MQYCARLEYNYKSLNQFVQRWVPAEAGIQGRKFSRFSLSGSDTKGFARLPSVMGFVRSWSLLSVLLALGVAGCSAEWMKTYDRVNTAYTARPANYRADIIAFMRTYLNDPVGIRDAAVSEPEIKTFDSNNRYVACLRYTARRGPAQNAGPRESLVLFLDGRLDRVVDNAREFCKGAAYQPFPELERLTR